MSNTQNKQDKLTHKELIFIDKYMETGNKSKAAIEAGYSPKTAFSIGNRLFRKTRVKNEIEKREAELHEKHIATADEVMRFFTKTMNGEIKDQFGLEATLGDRIKAGQELAKRTVDIQNRLEGKEDSTVHIKLDWE